VAFGFGLWSSSLQLLWTLFYRTCNKELLWVINLLIKKHANMQVQTSGLNNGSHLPVKPWNSSRGCLIIGWKFLTYIVCELAGIDDRSRTSILQWNPKRIVELYSDCRSSTVGEDNRLSGVQRWTVLACILMSTDPTTWPPRCRRTMTRLRDTLGVPSDVSKPP